jgi:hypothetical protein
LGIVQTQWNTNVSGCQLIVTPTDIVLSSIPITQPNPLTNPDDQNFQVSFDDLGFDDLGFDDLGFSSVPEQFQDATFSLNKGEKLKVILKAFKPADGNPGSGLSFEPTDDTIGQAAFGPNDPITGDPTGDFFDTTPPVITPIVDPTLGGESWYRSDVTVSWSVKDPQSGISSKSGCDTTELKMDTSGETLTCSAFNNAPDPEDRYNTVSITIKIDTEKPDTMITDGPADGSSISSTTVSFSFEGTDPPPSSGIALYECKLDSGEFSACVSPITLSDLSAGPHTFSVRATDIAGNIEDTPAIRTFDVTFEFVGFFSPLGAPDTYWGSNQLGNAQPIKYQLLFEGVPVNDLGTLRALEAYFTGPPDKNSCPVRISDRMIQVYSPGTGFKGASSFKSGNNQFTFSMDTKIFSPAPGKGCYTILLRFSDGQEKKGSLLLK